MFHNARHYNEEHSQVYKDAEVLEKLVKAKARTILTGADSPKARTGKPGYVFGLSFMCFAFLYDRWCHTFEMYYVHPLSCINEQPIGLYMKVYYIQTSNIKWTLGYKIVDHL